MKIPKISSFNKVILSKKKSINSQKIKTKLYYQTREKNQILQIYMAKI
jgi:hypothetical protein